MFSVEGEDKRKCSAKLNKSDPFVISKEGIFLQVLKSLLNLSFRKKDELVALTTPKPLPSLLLHF